MPIAKLSRKETFSASHRLHSSHLSEEDNNKIYGKCNNKNGHGHNYMLEVIVKGKIDPITGMVLNLVELKQYIKEAVLDQLDHKNMNEDVPEFKDRPPTTENVAVFIWESLLRTNLPKSMLYEIKLCETEKNVVIYRGE